MSDAAAARGAHAPGGAAEARRALLGWVAAAGEGGRVFLQLHLLALGGDRFRLRNVADRDADAGALRVHADPIEARLIAQTTEAGEHRPLKTAPNLRRGWSFERLDGRALWTALDYLYPACGVHWHAGETGTLRVTHWKETAARQSGMYSAVGLLPEPALRDTIRACCGDAVCLRRVAWRMAEGAEAFEAGSGGAPGMPDYPDDTAGDARVPCPEACSIFVSFSRKVLTLERSPRAEVPGLGTLNGAEAAQIRAIVAAAASGTLGAAREGEFDDPTNSRRVRYLAARLGGSSVERPADELPCEGCPRPVTCAGCPLV